MKDLYGRLMILAKSTRSIEQKGVVGNHEFTIRPKPRSLFCPDGSMLRCTYTSKWIRLLEIPGNEAELVQGRLPSEETRCVYEGPLDEDATHVLPTEGRDVERDRSCRCHVILHEVQSTALGTVVGLSHSFNDLLLSMTMEYYETILVFDTLKDVSLKYATREYPAMKVLTYNTDSPNLVITLSSGYTRSNVSVEFEDNNHEEADTPMIHHAVLSSLFEIKLTRVTRYSR